MSRFIYCYLVCVCNNETTEKTEMATKIRIKNIKERKQNRKLKEKKSVYDAEY